MNMHTYLTKNNLYDFRFYIKKMLLHEFTFFFILYMFSLLIIFTCNVSLGLFTCSLDLIMSILGVLWLNNLENKTVD